MKTQAQRHAFTFRCAKQQMIDATEEFDAYWRPLNLDLPFVEAIRLAFRRAIRAVKAPTKAKAKS